MLRQILEDCQQGFAEVVLMLSNSVTSVEVFTILEDLRFSDNDNIVTFLADGGTHLHTYMDQVKEVRFIYTVNRQSLPSYSVWLMGTDRQPVLRVYLRKSDKEETNQPRHDLFMGLRRKYGEIVRLNSY